MSLQRNLESFLGWCVSRSFEREKPLVIGVAGSVGKSSTKTAIGIAIGAGEPGSGVVASEKNYNNELGVPLTVFGFPPPHRSPVAWGLLLATAFLTAIGAKRLRAKTFVLEMATDKPGDLAYLVKIAKPTIGVLTAIGPEHTEYFGSVEGVAKEEAMILAALGPEGVGIVNDDDLTVRDVASAFPIRTMSFGTSDQATVRIISTRMLLEDSASAGLEVKLSMYGTTSTILLSGTVGRPQAYAAAAALATVIALDQDDHAACVRLQEKFHGLPGRMRLLEGVKRTWLIDDSYNSSPLAALSAVHDLSVFPVVEGAKRIAALGDMLELGSLAERAHVDMGRAVVEKGIDMLVACGTLAHIAANAAVEAGMPESSVFTFPDSREAGLFIQERLKQGDVVLIKGSQGARMERIAKELMAHPDKAEEQLVRHSKDWLAR